jgi:hypothetical protein
VTNTQHPGGDQDDPVLRGVAEYWDEIQGLASQQQRERLLGLLDGTAEPDPAEARAALEDELLDLLPPGHPLVRMLISRAMFRGIPQPAVGHWGAMVGRGGEAAAADTVPVTIYLADERIADQVEAAVEVLLEAAGLRIDKRNDPVVGSWFRRMVARASDGMRSGAAQDVTLTAARAFDSRLVLAQDADVTARLLQNLAPVLGALQPTKDAVIRVGALVVVKVEWAVSVFQLTAAQQTRLDHSPQLASSPSQIMAALGLSEKDSRGEDPGRAAVLDLYIEDPVLSPDSRFLRETGVSFGQPRVAPVADDELPLLDQKRPDLARLRLTELVLPFDLEEPPEGCRYISTTVRMTFDTPGVLSRRLAVPSAEGDCTDDSLLNTRGVGRRQLTWQLTARSDLVGLRPTGREVLALIESPLASERLTGTLDANVRFIRRMLGVNRAATAEPRHPLRFALNVADGSFEAAEDSEGMPGQ